MQVWGEDINEIIESKKKKGFIKMFTFKVDWDGCLERVFKILKSKRSDKKNDFHGKN